MLRRQTSLVHLAQVSLASAMPPTKSAVRGLADSEVKLLCSLPGIESSVVDVMKTLAALVTESADREERLNNRIDDLSRQIAGLNEEVVALRESAIASPRPATADEPQRTRTPQSRRRTRTRKGQAQDATRDQSQDATRATTDEGDVQHAGQRNLELEDDDNEPQTLDIIADDSWQLVAQEPPRAKKTVIFVGNLGTNCSEESIKTFVKRRAEAVGSTASVHNSSIHTTQTGKVSARICIDATDLSLVTTPDFWPRPLYARPWEYRDRPKPNRQHPAGAARGDPTLDGADSADSDSTASAGTPQ